MPVPRRSLLFAGLTTMLVFAAPKEADTAALPDLQVLGGFTTTEEGKKVVVRCTNWGDGGAGTFRVRVRSHWDGKYHTVISFTALPQAGHTTREYLFTFPPYPMKYIMFHIDYEHWVNESNESNNTHYSTW